MAVVFPLSLICIDFLFEGRFTKKLIIQKLPFLLASFICGSLAVYTQNKTGAIAAFNVLTIQERVMYACYGFDMYVYKFFNPSFLSTFYPYPYRYISGWLPAIYYLAPFIAVIIIAAPAWITYKKNREYFKIVVFGLGFFIVNVIFELQFISCGAAIMADRYSYIAYIGLFFLLAYFLYELVKLFPSFKAVILALTMAWSGLLSYQCYQRTFVWHNSETLLSDAIEKYPFRALLSYKWLGNYYMDQGQIDKALENYSVLTMLNSADAKIYDQVGDIYTQKRDFNNALKSFDKSLAVQNNVYKTYLDRALIYATMGDSTDAAKDYFTALRLNPQSQEVWANTGFISIQSKQYAPSLIEYNLLLMVDPNNPLSYFYRGVAWFGLNKMQQAAKDWVIAVNYKAKDVSPNAAYNLSIACDSLGNDSAAVRYANMAKSMGYSVDDDYMNKLKKREASK